MRIAVGIIGLTFSLLALLQSCAVTGLSAAAGMAATQQAGTVGVLMALAMFFGGAFSFALPRVAQIMFSVSFLLSLLAKKEFPDLQIWGWIALALGMLLAFWGTPKNTTNKN